MHNKEKSKEELKVFLTFFILYSFFIHLIGWNENTRIILARILVEKNKFEIDEYANFTGDRIFFDGHFYSDKPPAVSFFTMLPYSLFYKIFSLEKEQLCYAVESLVGSTLNCVQLGKGILLTQILSTVLFSVLPAVLAIIVLYKILFFLYPKINKKILFITIGVFGLATVHFQTALVLFGHSLFVLLSLIIFYLFIKMKNKSQVILTGLLLGLLTLVDYFALLLVPIFSLLILLKKKTFKIFLVCLLLGSLPTLLYNYAIFGNLFTFALKYWNAQKLVEPYAIQQFTLSPDWYSFKLFTIKESLIGSYRGVLFYYPVLFFALIGLLFSFKANRFLFFLTLIFLILNLWFIPVGFGGSFFGLRFFSFSTPFLVLLLPLFLRRFCDKELVLIVFILLFFISVFHNFVGLAKMAESFFEIGRPISNPIYSYFLPAFLENGPRSRIFEQAIIGQLPDIRDFKPMPIEEIKLFTLSPFGILVLKIPFLVIPILLFTLVLIWRTELFRIFVFKKISIGLLLLILIVLLFSSRFEFKDIVYDKSWHPLVGNETIRWMPQNAALYIFSTERKNVFLNISLSSYRAKTLHLYLNDNFINSYTQAFKIIERVSLESGENTLIFNSREGCERPIFAEEGGTDYRCLSFGIESIELLEEDKLKVKNETLYYGSNWYSEEIWQNQTYRYMSQDATIILLPYPKRIKLNISIDAYKKPRILDLYLNGKLIDSYLINSFFTTIITPEITLEEEINFLKFHSREGCDIPAKTGDNSNDFRCLSFAVKNITKLTTEELMKSGKTLIFGKNWYQPENDGRWSSGNSTIFLFIPNSTVARLNLSLIAYKEPRILDLYINENKIGSYLVAETLKNFLTKPIQFRKGENIVFFATQKDCEVPLKINDTRCLNFKLFNISLFTSRDLSEKDKDLIFAEGWWLEKDKDRSFRWMGQNASIQVFNPSGEKRKMNMSFIVWSYHKPRTLYIYLNEEEIVRIKVLEKSTYNFTLELIPGLNELKFHSLEGCDVPAEIENEKDIRCLSFAISDLLIDS
jgi:hypothetical protein